MPGALAWGAHRATVSWPIVVVALGLAVRLALVVAGSGRPETFEYDDIAREIVAGNGFRYALRGTWYHTFGSPPFVFLCAGVYALGLGLRTMLVIQSVCTSVAALIAGRIAARLGGPSAAVIAAALVAFHPGLVLYDVRKVHPLGFDTLLATAGLAAALSADRWSQRRAFGAGLLHGLAVLERTTFAGVGAIALAVWMRRPSRGHVARAAVYALGVVLVFAPWVARNYHVLHAFVPVTTNSGEVFWRGNNPEASGGAFAQTGDAVPIFDVAPPELRRAIVGQDELTQGRAFSAAAWSFVRDHPAETARLYLSKLRAFWWFSPQAGLLYPAAYLGIYKVFYGVLLCLGVAGAWRAWRAPDPRAREAAVLMTLFVVSVSVVQAAFYVEVRHRWSIEPVLLVFAAAALAPLARRLGVGPSSAS